ncbi:MAG: hypothetical protein AAGU11_02315 [Syntrophobacteraceae bacterium]
MAEVKDLTDHWRDVRQVFASDYADGTRNSLRKSDSISIVSGSSVFERWRMFDSGEI